jgi:hypothetical protein
MTRKRTGAPQNRVLADSALASLSTLAPEHVRSRIERVVLGLTDPRIVAALGFEEPSASYRRRVAGAMRDYAFENRPGMPGGGPVAGLIASLYPDGYDISRLGTHLSPAGTRPHAQPPRCPVVTNAVKSSPTAQR